MNLNKVRPLVEEWARQVGEIQLRYFRSADLEIATKYNDFDVVTRADKESEALMISKSMRHSLTTIFWRKNLESIRVRAAGDGLSILLTAQPILARACRCSVSQLLLNTMANLLSAWFMLRISTRCSQP